jgi:acyl carrier protein
MTRQELEQNVNEFLIQKLEIKDELKPTSKLYYDLGIDSIDIVEIVGIIEEKFGIIIKTPEIKAMNVLQDLYNCIEKKLYEF